MTGIGKKVYTTIINIPSLSSLINLVDRVNYNEWNIFNSYTKENSKCLIICVYDNIAIQKFLIKILLTKCMFSFCHLFCSLNNNNVPIYNIHISNSTNTSGIKVSLKFSWSLWVYVWEDVMTDSDWRLPLLGPFVCSLR